MNVSLSKGALDLAVCRRPALTLLAVTSMIMAGCATEPMPSGSRLIVTAKHAEFYKNGPAQDMIAQSPQTAPMRTVAGDDFGPDRQLPKGAYVTLIRKEIGFSRVMTAEGVVGYVANDQMQRAPTIARTTVSPRLGEPWKPASSPRRQKSAPTRSPEDQLDLSDIPLPLPS